jgi:formylglycine-generating enzyme required for sulfatase activity
MGMAVLMVLLGIIIIIKWKRSPDGSRGEVSLEIKETNDKRPAATLSGEPGKNPARYKNSLGMEFVLVPPGKFFMGGNGGRIGQKEVEIPCAFYLGVYEVTQKEWQTVTGMNPSSFSRTGCWKDVVKDIPDEVLRLFPVETISWNKAQLFLKALNAREKGAGWVYRLPREVEWEYACRGGPRANPFEYGFDFYFEKPTNQLLPEQANITSEGRKGLGRPCKVGSYTPNSLGLYDMHGNVKEWCEDEERTPDGTSHRVDRGGSWECYAGSCKAAERRIDTSSDGGPGNGMRLACQISSRSEPFFSQPSATTEVVDCNDCVIEWP